MTTKYTLDHLREMFQLSFNFDVWHQFQINCFRVNDSKKPPQKIIGNTADDSFYLGYTYTTDGYRIGLFFHKKTKSVVCNKRKELHTIVKEIRRAHSEIYAAITVFDKGTEWELSFIYDIKDESSAPKRRTYIFGDKNLSYKTAIERFYILQEKDFSFDNLKAAFSAETLSNAFFDNYCELYADFIQSITGKRLVKRGNKWEEKSLSKPNETLMQTFGYNEKRIREYVKKMMGRITFLHFLQRKGWMCGDLNFMQNMFEQSAHKEDYLATLLEPLFFGILNCEYSEREALFSKHGWDKSLLNEWKDIPFLNSGLFECDETDKITGKFPSSHFKRFLQFLSDNIFTLRENTPDDAEVSIDPEILAKIFENLLEEKKDKGTFYTPKEIVRYMCRESLISYLESNTSIAKEKIRPFVYSPEENADNILNNEKLAVLAALEEVKICDPAIGSGAFSMGIFDELLHCREALSCEHNAQTEIKKSIIKNNIYGVDIEKGAVDIARLRLWLSIVIDEKRPSSDICYNIMQGNSLIESFMGTDLSKLTYEKECKNKKEEASLLKELLSNLLQEYHSCHHCNKKIKIEQEISETINRLLKREAHDSAIIDKLKNINLAANNKFFLWHIWFGNVFNREKNNGFDIVIGNPPFIGEKGHKELFQCVKNDTNLGKFYMGKMDYFYLFFHLSFNIVSDNGICTFITTNYYPTASGAKRLRDDIKERMNIRQLFNLGELRLFENAQGQHNMISSFSKSRENCKCSIIDVHTKGVLDAQLFASIINHRNQDTTYSEIEQHNIYDGKENYIRLKNDSNNATLSSLLNKIQSESDILGEIAEVNTGIMGGCDSITNHNIKYADAYYIESNDIRTSDGVFVLESKNSRDSTIIEKIKHYPFCKEFYKSSDINCYYTQETTGKILIFSSPHTPLCEQEIIKSSLEKYRPILTKIREINSEKSYYWHMLRRGTAHQHIFTGAKIVSPQRSKRNTFGYNECDWYASADVYYITNPRKDYHIKYILGLLNSRLYYLWLYHKGKRKGETLELYQKPLSEIPIRCASQDIQNSIIEIVNRIIELKKSNPRHDISTLQHKIETILYRLYKLTDAEIEMVENCYLLLQQE